MRTLGAVFGVFGTIGSVRWLACAVALSILQVSLTFVNVWPTLDVRPTADLTVELPLAILLLIGFSRWRTGSLETLSRVLSIGWVLLIVGRYVDVTTRSLYGREVNIYWDMRHIPKVGAMFSTVANPWQIVMVIVGVVVCPIAVYLLTRWCFRQVSTALQEHSVRLGFNTVAICLCLLFVMDRAGYRPTGRLRFADPVSVAYAGEIFELFYEMSGAGVDALGPAPSMASDFRRVKGADVFIIFMESYGVVSWNRPEFVEALADSRAALTEAITETGRSVVSAAVESTTFGGESWLAHVSLLSGTEVRDGRANARLLAQERNTLVKEFGRNGYRTIAVMPGHLMAWPEGEFYGFDEVYDHAKLDYRGPPFGWWSVTDQYALASVDALEIKPSQRSPRLVFFPTISTHAPFTPVPPYQSDWERVLTESPYDQNSLDRAWSDWPDWMNLGPSYVKALRYAYDTVGGYLRLRGDRDFVVLLIGDHQPPSLVSGEGASWDVPVHVIASRAALLDHFRRAGFVEGLTPSFPAITRMEGLLLTLLSAFGDPPGAAMQHELQPEHTRGSLQ